jgi:Ca2+-binding RTX toxin-like protein
VPGPTSGGIYTFTVTASDGTLPNVTTPFTLTVGQAAQFISASHVTFNAGTAGSFRISTSGFPTASLREAGTLPAGVSFHDNGDGSGTISGTPPANGGNAYIVSITATNSIVGTASQVFTLTVNQPPAITSLGGASFSGGVSGSFTITSTGFPRPRFTVLSGSLPAGLNFQDNNNGTATISGTPVENTSSIDTIVISASNGAGPAVTQSFTVTVNALPVITNINGTLTGTGTLTGDTVNFSTGNGNLIATIDSVSASFPLTTVQALVISLANSTGNNTISIGAGAPVALVIGGSGNDTIIASNTARDTLEGGAGNDSIHAGGAKELLQGNSGNDTLIAGTGNDTLVGGNGADSLYGGPGADLLQGGAGPDTIVTGGGNNTLSGGAGHDSILGGSGSNLLDGGIGTDTIVGGSGDTITDVTPGSTILHSS